MLNINFIQKYKKYKNKYLELKKQIGSGKNEKRIGSEIKHLQTFPELYESIIQDTDRNIKLKRISDNSTLEVIFPDGFPFKAPLIKLNNKQVLINNWDTKKRIKDLLDLAELSEVDKIFLKSCKNEMENLQSFPKLYKDIVQDMDGNINLKKINDNSTIDIIFLDDFPNKEVLNNNNKSDAINNWNKCVQIKFNNKQVAIDNLDMTVNIKNLLDLLDFDKKVLILCHNTLVTGTFVPLTLNNHWFGYIFPRLFEKYNLEGKPLFETVDIRPGGTYNADAFSNVFVDSHQGEYDLVIVPDCNGSWYEFQYEDPESVDNFLSLCLKLTIMIKPTGLILFSKLMKKGIIPLLNDVLQRNNFITEIINENVDEEGRERIPKCIIAQKKDTAIRG